MSATARPLSDLEGRVLGALSGGAILKSWQIAERPGRPRPSILRVLKSLQTRRLVTSWGSDGARDLLWASEDVPQYAPERLKSVQPCEENEPDARAQRARQGRQSAKADNPKPARLRARPPAGAFERSENNSAKELK